MKNKRKMPVLNFELEKKLKDCIIATLNRAYINRRHLRLTRQHWKHLPKN